MWFSEKSYSPNISLHALIHQKYKGKNYQQVILNIDLLYIKIQPRATLHCHNLLLVTKMLFVTAPSQC